MGWNYKSKVRRSSGYEDVLNELKKYNKIKFLVLSDQEKADLIDHIFDIYRAKNIFPIQYFNTVGIKEEIQKCIDKEVSFDGDVLNLNFNQGSSLCRFLFPGLAKVDCKGTEGNSPFDKFMNDVKLKKAIGFCLAHKSSNCPVTPSGIKDGLEMLGGNVATNFKPMNAKALYEKFTPVNGVIFDYACGFGGRLLGALTSKNNYKYIGVDPNTETYKRLTLLGKYIELTTGQKGKFKILCKGSEEFKLKGKEFIDFAFSSPPYFNLEKYNDEETQCYNKFPELEDWFEYYVEPTIRNIYGMLKCDRHYAVNIADFNIGKNKVEFVDRWIEISKEVGFVFDHQLHMKLQTRRGAGHDTTNKKTKKEGIFVFKKK